MGLACIAPHYQFFSSLSSSSLFGVSSWENGVSKRRGSRVKSLKLLFTWGRDSALHIAGPQELPLVDSVTTGGRQGAV